MLNIYTSNALKYVLFINKKKQPKIKFKIQRAERLKTLTNQQIKICNQIILMNEMQIIYNVVILVHRLVIMAIANLQACKPPATLKNTNLKISDILAYTFSLTIVKKSVYEKHYYK